MEIKGLDMLTKHLDELQKFLSEVDEASTELKFDPTNAESIEQAIIKMEDFVNELSGKYSSNSTVMNQVTSIKEIYRQAIIDKAAEDRLAIDSQGITNDS